MGKDGKKLILARVILEALMEEVICEWHFKAQMNFQKIPVERRWRSFWKRKRCMGKMVLESKSCVQGVEKVGPLIRDPSLVDCNLWSHESLVEHTGL